MAPGYPTFWHARGYGLFAANPLGQAALTDGRLALNLTLEPDESATFRHRLAIETDPPAAKLDADAAAWAAARPAAESGGADLGRVDPVLPHRLHRLQQVAAQHWGDGVSAAPRPSRDRGLRPHGKAEGRVRNRQTAAAAAGGEARQGKAGLGWAGLGWAGLGWA
eukprot:SAG11_NODE_11823_length_736_cov_1.474097_2_plen_164_part_01